MSHTLADVSTASPIRTVAEAGAYVAAVCFKHGPPRHIGLELEWLLLDPNDPTRHPDPDTLRAALGPHAPTTLDPHSPTRPLPSGGLVTVEPGGQVEISSPVHTSPAALVAAMRRDQAHLITLLAPTGFTLSDWAIEHARPARRILDTPRYHAMAAGFARQGPAGARMMCASAATQVCLDLGTAEDAATRWQLAHALGPVLLAAFANSRGPGVVSDRMAAWWALDPVRTAPPTRLEPAAYVDRVLHTPVLARRQDGDWLLDEPVSPAGWLERGDPLTTADLDLHLSMLFPPVRPQGYLELRYLDAQPGQEWLAPLALLTGLFAGPLSPVAEIVAPVSGHWQQATRLGLADPALARAARELAGLVPAALDRLDLDRPDRELAESLLHRRLSGPVAAEEVPA